MGSPSEAHNHKFSIVLRAGCGICCAPNWGRVASAVQEWARTRATATAPAEPGGAPPARAGSPPAPGWRQGRD